MAFDGMTTVGTKTDRRTGNFRETGNTTDLAIGGDGFFVVFTSAGERFVRGGSTRLDPEGFLADQDGSRLLGKKGAIRIGDGRLSINAQGDVSVDGREVDRLRMETVPPGASLTHEGGTRFVPGDSRIVLSADQRDVRQGFVEESNADSLGGLVDMISVQRAYSAVEKTISVLDHVNDVAASQLGRAST